MVVDYSTKEGVFSSGKPRQWSPAATRNPSGNPSYALHPDGKRLAVFPLSETAAEESGNAHLAFLLNFGDELRRRLAPRN